MTALYHFTSRFYLPFILGNGITRGDVPLSQWESVNGVWLTKDGRRHRQKYNRTSRFVEPGGEVCCHDKAEIRLTVDVSDLPLLYSWDRLATGLGLDPDYVRWLNRAGNENGDLWFVSLSKIPLKMIVKIERDANGSGAWREVADPYDPALFPRLTIVSVSSWELETGRKIMRVPVEEVLSLLRCCAI